MWPRFAALGSDSLLSRSLIEPLNAERVRLFWGPSEPSQLASRRRKAERRKWMTTEAAKSGQLGALVALARRGPNQKPRPSSRRLAAADADSSADWRLPTRSEFAEFAELAEPRALLTPIGGAQIASASAGAR